MGDLTSFNNYLYYPQFYYSCISLSSDSYIAAASKCISWISSASHCGVSTFTWFPRLKRWALKSIVGRMKNSKSEKFSPSTILCWLT